ncbi:MAG: imidazole glycerol phosphate synthase subunit HisH [Gemmatimonadetes bacterium]|nr:imidazole glycerol phosphate synthase subunit HisH [Gemmatimonadota bacterium]
MIVIVDYGMGNIKAFANAFERMRQPFSIARSRGDLAPARKILLPGVGSFDCTMRLLDESGMRDQLDEMVIRQKVPVLGVCVGLQMMARSSEEGARPGLGWIDGEVKKFQPAEGVRIPHMGWNNVSPARKHPLLEGLDDTSRFYFLHSYYFACDSGADVLATTGYDGTFTCAIAHENILGVQFHPEKSHQWGSQLLENFARL